MLVVIVDLTVQYCYVGCYSGFDCTILLCWLLWWIWLYNIAMLVVMWIWLYNIAMLVVIEWIWLYNIAMLVVMVDLTVQYCYVGCYSGFDCTILLCWLLESDLTVQYCYVGCYEWIWLYNIAILVVIVDLTVQYCYVGCYGGFDSTILLCWLL